MELLIQTIIVVFVAGIVFDLILLGPKKLTLLVFKYFSGVNYNTVVGAVKEKKDLIIKIVVVIVVCSVALFLTNTQIKKVGKNTYINNFEQFVVKVQENHKDYSEEDWTKIEEEYLDLSEKKRLIYEDLLTKEDKKRLSRLEGQYLSYRTSGFIDNIMKTTKDVFINAVEYIDGFIEAEEIEVEDKKEKL